MSRGEARAPARASLPARRNVVSGARGPAIRRTTGAVALLSVTLLATGCEPRLPMSNGGSGPNRATSTTDRSGRSTAAGPLINEVRWVTRGGRRALEVTPGAGLRRDPTAENGDLAWAEVLRRTPRADRPGMKDQFRCHVQFAPSKRHFHLEPWRPAVGYARTVANGCNPGERKDLG